MHLYRVIFLPLLMAAPSFAQIGPAVVDHDQARWADWEAQSRMTDGDYDGAVQAEQQANTDRHEAAQHRGTTGSPKDSRSAQGAEPR